MAKSARTTYPFRDAETNMEVWVETNTTNNRVKGVKKLQLKKYNKRLRKHVVFTQAKRPSNIQQGGKKKH